MKKIGLLLVLCMGVTLQAQQTDTTASTDSDTPQGTVFTNATFPTERVQTPTQADIYCAGMVNKDVLPNANFVAGGANTPNTTKFVNGDVVYLMGSGYQTGQQYTVLRELTNPNHHEVFNGQTHMIKEMGQPYAEIARVRIIDTRSRTAIGQVEFSCDPISTGDLVVPFAEKTSISFHPPVRFDRYVPSSSKLQARIVLARDFESILGTGAKVYMNMGSNQGVKVGDYFRAVRNYDADLHDEADSLSFKATVVEDTQKRPPSVDAKMFTKTNGPNIHVADLPRRAVGELVILSTTPTTSTGMIVFALEDVHVGDGIEQDMQQ